MRSDAWTSYEEAPQQIDRHYEAAQQAAPERGVLGPVVVGTATHSRGSRVQLGARRGTAAILANLHGVLIHTRAGPTSEDAP
jgi:hypothetical protein